MKKEKVERLQKIYVGVEEEDIYFSYYGKLGKQIAVTLTIGFLLVSVSSFIRQNSNLLEGYFLEREAVDGKEKAVTIHADSGEKEKNITVLVPNRKYSAAEAKEMLQKAKKELEKRVLGNNSSDSKISSALDLCTRIPGYAVSINWEVPMDAPVQSDGRLKNDNLKKPEQVVIKAILSCGSFEETWEKAFIVLPKKKKELSFWEKWKKAYKKSEKQSEAEKYVRLPKEVDGEKVNYTEEKISYSYILFALVFLCCLFWIIRAEGRLKSQIQSRQEQLLIDYPEFIEHFVLLVGAGLNIKSTWEKIVYEYEKGRMSKDLISEKQSQKTGFGIKKLESTVLRKDKKLSENLISKKQSRKVLLQNELENQDFGHKNERFGILGQADRGEKKRASHFVYEEMAVTIREIENGMSEARAYELFGKRTELLSYMKFCTMIVQNLKKGSSDLLKLLEYEMTDSFHARKENAKVLGEKAGTKLLMPMAMMLIIVFVLILYAAFQGMS